MGFCKCDNIVATFVGPRLNMKKSATLRIRLDPNLHRDFFGACHAEDRPAAQVVRELMRKYIREHPNNVQNDLFQPRGRGVE